MLKDNYQMTMEMDLSPYQGLYELIIPQEHLLRRLRENIQRLILCEARER